MSERQAWNEWNTQSNREFAMSEVQRGQVDVITGWLDQAAGTGRLRILDVGCGAGWLSERLAPYGDVTGVDLADEVLERARVRLARFDRLRLIAGDFMELRLDDQGLYDAVVTVETMAHFQDQAAFLRRISALLVPGGTLIIAAQNRPMMERNIAHLPNHGWYRRWVDRAELDDLVSQEFDVHDIHSIVPKFFAGPLHIVNSERVGQIASSIGLGWPLGTIKRWEEEHDMGFTLMCLATKKLAAVSAGKADRVERTGSPGDEGDRQVSGATSRGLGSMTTQRPPDASISG